MNGRLSTSWDESYVGACDDPDRRHRYQFRNWLGNRIGVVDPALRFVSPDGRPEPG